MANQTPVNASQALGKSLNYLNNLYENRNADFLDIPDKMQPYINNFVREGHKKFIELDFALKNIPKDTDEHTYAQNMIDTIAKSWVTVRKQIDLYKDNQEKFRDIVPNINAGTKEENLNANAMVYGNEWDDLKIEENGEFLFGVAGAQHKLGDMPRVIDEPYVGKNYIFKLAEKVKLNKDQNRPFDRDWVYRNILDNLNRTGPEGVIGLAYTDLAGDGITRSFAEMWDTGLKDKTLYTNPQNGGKLPKDSTWMKDLKNSKVLSEILSQHITNVMIDIYGTIDSKTGQVKKTGQGKKTRADLANELIKKYSKSI